MLRVSRLITISINLDLHTVNIAGSLVAEGFGDEVLEGLGENWFGIVMRDREP